MHGYAGVWHFDGGLGGGRDHTSEVHLRYVVAIWCFPTNLSPSRMHDLLGGRCAMTAVSACLGAGSHRGAIALPDFYYPRPPQAYAGLLPEIQGRKRRTVGSS